MYFKMPRRRVIANIGILHFVQYIINLAQLRLLGNLTFLVLPLTYLYLTVKLCKFTYLLYNNFLML